MKHIALITILAACGTDSTTPTSPACAEADGYQNLASIETKIFSGSCALSSCHGGRATQPALGAGKAYAALVNVRSQLDPSRTLVVPGDPQQSFLMVMLGAVAPGAMSPPLSAVPTPGVMPLAGTQLCTEKLDAISRWIEAGAPND